MYNTQSQTQTQSNLAARLATLNRNNLSNEALYCLFRDIDLDHLTEADAVLLDDLLGFEDQHTRQDDINKEVRLVLLGATGSG